MNGATRFLLAVPRSALASAVSGLALAVFGSGCDGDSQAANFVMRDSAAITIVENVTPLWADSGRAWRVEVEPALTIGVVEGAPEYQLFRARHALRLDDGVIVVADGGSRELRFYDRDGRHIRSVGGDGEGPGEFRVVSLLARYGADSLAVYDGRLERASILDRQGRFGRSFRRPDIGSFVYVYGFFRDGSLLGSVDQGLSFDTMSTGVIRVRSVHFRMTAEGEVDTIGRFFSGESYVEGARVSSMPFARSAVRAIDGDQLHHGTSETYEIRTYTTGGELTRIVRLQRPEAPLTQEVIDAYIAATSANIDDPQWRVDHANSIREMPHAATMPAYRAALVDAERNLWVADYRLRGDNESRWTIFNPEGQLLGTIQPPAGLTITDIGADYVLGIARDEFDIEQVVMYRLRKPATRGGGR